MTYQLKSGTICITGKPNVGKSSLTNQIVKDKVAIVTYKPQTTRNQIFAYYKDQDSQFCLIDTPGYHKPNNKLDIFLNSEIKKSYKIVDFAILLIDLTRPIDHEDNAVIELLNKFKIDKIILVFTKKDLVKNESVIQQYKNQLKTSINPLETLVINTNNKDDIQNLINVIKKYLPNEDAMNFQAISDQFLIAEIIREQILLLYHKEIPYASNVQIESQKYDQAKNLFTIQAVITVEKESQKPIIIGHHGQAIKNLGIKARKELLKIYDCKIDLKLFVKVESNWRNNEHLLKDFGYR